LNIELSQGSAATEFRCGGRFYFTMFRSLSTNPKVKELLQSVNICQRYRKNKSGTFFMAHGVVSRNIRYMRIFDRVPRRGGVKRQWSCRRQGWTSRNLTTRHQIKQRCTIFMLRATLLWTSSVSL